MWSRDKSLYPTGNRTPDVKIAARHYADYATSLDLKKLGSLSPRANYSDRAAAAFRPS
jgi:hypothetical protein